MVDNDILVSVEPLLLMPQAEGVHEFVDDDVSEVPCFDPQGLLAPRSPTSDSFTLED